MGLTSLLLFVGGLVALTVGSELLVRGAASLAVAAGVSPLVVGLTIVALGTSAPEMTVSVVASLEGEPDIALGNVIGSNILNILLILGAAAAIAPLAVSRQLIRFDVPLMIGVSLLVTVFALNGRIGPLEGGLLLLGLVVYISITVFRGRRVKQPPASDEMPPLHAAATPGAVLRQLALVAAGLVLLAWGSNALVQGATAMARALGVGELVIGLTIVAAGTSLPEAATSILAAIRGQREIAVGNAIGSNLFNLLGVLGLAGLVSPAGIAVSPEVLRFDLPVMVTVAVACLPVFFTGHRIARSEGLMFLGYYLVYTTYLVLVATDAAVLPRFELVMIAFVLPATVLLLLASTAYAWGKQRRLPAQGE